MEKVHHSKSAIDILSSKLNNKKRDMAEDDDDEDNDKKDEKHSDMEKEDQVDYSTSDDNMSMISYSNNDLSISSKEQDIDNTNAFTHMIVKDIKTMMPRNNPDKEWISERLFNYFNVIIEYLFYKMNAPYVCPFIDKRYTVKYNEIREEYASNNSVLKELLVNDIGSYMDSLDNLIKSCIFYIEHHLIKRLAVLIANAKNGVMMSHTKPGCPETVDDYVTIEDQDVYSMISGNIIGRRLTTVKKTDIIHIYDIDTGEYIGSVGDSDERRIVDYLNRFIHVQRLIEIIVRDFMIKMDVSVKKNRTGKTLKNYLKYQPDSKYAIVYNDIIELRDDYDELQYLEGMFKCMITPRRNSQTEEEFDIVSAVSEMFLSIYEIVFMRLSSSNNINYSLFKSKLFHLNIKVVEDEDEIDSYDNSSEDDNEMDEEN